VAPVLPVALVVADLLFRRGEGRRPRDAARLYALVAAGMALAMIAHRVLLRVCEVPGNVRMQELGETLRSWEALLIPLKIFEPNFAIHYHWWGWLTREGSLVLGVAVGLLALATVWRDVRAPGPEGREARVRWALVGAGAYGAAFLFCLSGTRELRTKPFLTLVVIAVALHVVARTRSWARVGPKGAVVFAVVALTMWSGRQTLSSGFVAYAVEELAYAERALARADLSGRRVHLVQPQSRCFSPPCYGHFEFKLKLAAEEDWVPRGLLSLALARLGHDPASYQLTFSRELPSDPAAVVVDERELERRLYAERGEYVDLEELLKRRRSGPVEVVGFSGMWFRVAPGRPAGP
jgi:hypothetical protein